MPLYNLMEDAATAEISRTQLWQWVHHEARLDDGRAVDADLYRTIRERGAVLDPGRVGEARRNYVERAARIFDELILADELADFLTLPAYDALLELETIE